MSTLSLSLLAGAQGHGAAAAAAHGGHGAVSASTTYLFTGLLVGLILCLAFEEKLHAKKSLIAGSFALLALALGGVFGILPFDAESAAKGAAPLTNAFGEVLYHPVFIQGVDWGVIGIIFGASVFVDVSARSGLFTWIALRLTRASGGDPYRLLWAYGLMTVVFSAVLNNVTAMIIVGSLTGVSLERLERREQLLGFLLIEGLLTNVGGLLTLISSVPNLLVGTAAGISFLRFFVVAAPYVLVATVVTIWVGARVAGIRALDGEGERAAAAAKIEAFEGEGGIEHRGFFILSAALLILFVIMIAAASALPVVNSLGMAFVALSFAAVILWRYKAEVDQFYREVDWDLLGFFIGLFAFINVIEHAQVLHLIGGWLSALIGLGAKLGTGALLIAASLFSSVTDNIPLAAMLAKILSAQGTAGDSPLWWSVIFGANLGGNLTPIGSASTLVAVTIMHKQGLAISFAGFVKKALPFALIQLTLATIYVLIFL
ncbi:MAG: SLC13 family permease [Myxococcota bacterium]|nr:SLC13 family permease [Myxococcota bacterium]